MFPKIIFEFLWRIHESPLRSYRWNKTCQSSLVKDTKSCFKYSDPVLHTFYETTKQISFDSKLQASCNESSGLFNLQGYIILATNISIPDTENCWIILVKV